MAYHVTRIHEIYDCNNIQAFAKQIFRQFHEQAEVKGWYDTYTNVPHPQGNYQIQAEENKYPINFYI